MANFGSPISVAANFRLLWNPRDAQRTQSMYATALSNMEKQSVQSSLRANAKTTAAHKQVVASLRADTERGQKAMEASTRTAARNISAQHTQVLRNIKSQERAASAAGKPKLAAHFARQYRNQLKQMQAAAQEFSNKARAMGIKSNLLNKQGLISVSKFMKLQAEDRRTILLLMDKEKHKTAELRTLYASLTAAHKVREVQERKQHRIKMQNSRAEEAHLRQTTRLIALQEQVRRNNMRVLQQMNMQVEMASQQLAMGFRNAVMASVIALSMLSFKMVGIIESVKEFEKELINAQSIFQTTDEILFNMSDTIVNFGTKFGIELNKASEGLYQYASAGVTAADALQMLQHTLKLSMAVQGDHNALAKLTTQTIMGFNMEFSEAAMVTDKFAHAINKSLIEWDDLASSVKFALPFFISTGQSLDTLLGALEILTNRALEAGIAGRGLRQALAQFAKHADDNAASFRKMGVEILDTNGNMKDLTEIALDFRAAMGDQMTDMDVMITLMEDLNIRGATAFVHLVQSADEFKGAVEDLSNSAGSAHEMAMIQQESLANQIQRLKNALLAPFLLSDKMSVANGQMNEFSSTLHEIVEGFEALFIDRMADGTFQITEFGKIIQETTLQLLQQLGRLVFELMGLFAKLTENGRDFSGLLNAILLPLRMVVKVFGFFGEGILEAIVAYKILNAILPINTMMTMQNLQAIGNLQGVQSIQNATVVAGTAIKTVEGEVVGQVTATKQIESVVMENQLITYGKLIRVQLMSRGIMFGAMLLTQKFAKDSTILTGLIGAVAGAYMGYAIALQMVAAAQLEVAAGGAMVGVNMTRAMLWGAAAGATFNILLQELMKPAEVDMPVFDNSGMENIQMDSGGRIVASMQRSAAVGRHFPVMVEPGETIIPKTQNMLGGGITINMGDVYANDAEDFAERLVESLPEALRRQNDIGGI
tara:strand:- start:3878 stop:6694 length:2817 start_codon:yes stop_codon:yes gene_type:complete